MNEIEQLKDICESFYASHYIPIALIDNKEVLCFSCCYNSYPKIIENILPILTSLKMNPAVKTTDYGIFGVVQIRQENLLLVIGPFVNKEITDQYLNTLIHNCSISWVEKDEIKQFLSEIPVKTYHQFLNIIAFLHLLINREKIDVITHFKLTDPKYKKKVMQNYTKNKFDDEKIKHSTFILEKRLLDYVSKGDVLGLKVYFNKLAKQANLKAGKVAETPLRQEKNIFIGLVTVIGKIGAIKGGLDVEEAYGLIDVYTQECERCQSIEQVSSLRINALLDFTTRVADKNNHQKYSPEIIKALEYIKSCTNMYIDVMDVVSYIGTSRTYLLERFKRETGTTLGKAITLAKLDDAKMMLTYSEKSLSEISEDLCFSSQSYFQNVFKKELGVTPLEYRKEHPIDLD